MDQKNRTSFLLLLSRMHAAVGIRQWIVCDLFLHRLLPSVEKPTLMSPMKQPVLATSFTLRFLRPMLPHGKPHSNQNTPWSSSLRRHPSFHVDIPCLRPWPPSRRLLRRSTTQTAIELQEPTFLWRERSSNESELLRQADDHPWSCP